MAITDSQKIDYLFKKIGYGVAKTDVSTIKSPSNEPNASPLLLRGENIWQQSSLITTVSTLPTANSNVMSVYRDTLSSTVQSTNDGTASTNRTWKTNLTDWIGPEFGSGYAVKVYTGASGNGSPQTLASLPADGSGNNDSWYFDYQSGILNFADTNVPTAVTGNVIYISGARYVGSKGVSIFPNGLGAGNITLSGNTITSSSGNLYIGTTLTVINTGDISANIGVLYANAVSQQGSLNSINANLGTYQTWANANAASQATTLVTLDANLGVLYTGNTTTQANIGTILANLITQQGNFNTLNANVGAYETWANANLATQTTNFNTLNANVGVLYSGNISTQANIGVILANLVTQQGNFNTLNANVGAYETYANANAVSQQTQIISLATNANANTAAYLPTYSGTLGGTLSTVTQNSVTTMTGLVTIGTAGVTTTVAGNLLVGGNLTVTGNSVSIGASTLSITDPIINLNTSSDLTPLTAPTTSDIGIKFHYFTVALGDSHAFVGRAVDTGYLEWYDTGNDSANVFTGNTYGTVKTGALILANARVVGGGLSANTGTFQVYGDGSLSGNLYVGSTLTILNAGDVSANIGVLYANAIAQQGSINNIVANTGAYYTWANANLAAQQGNFNTLNANVGVLYSGNISTQANIGVILANLVTQQGNFNTLNANVGTYETWANANLATQTTNFNTLNANVGVLYSGNISTQANIGLVYANLVTQQGNFNTLNANVGTYETWANANLATQTTNFNTLNANVGVLYSGNITTQANIGLVYANLVTQQGNYNTLNANVGTYETWANANLAAQQGNFNTLNANVGTYETWANANLATQTTNFNTLNANVGVLYSGNISTQANIGTLYANAVTQQGSINTLNANVGAYETWANANLATQTTGISAYSTWANANLATQTTNFNTLNANVGAYETWANANLATQTTNFNTLNANVGAYETTVNANLITQQGNFNTLNANVGILYSGNISTQANIGVLYANAIAQQGQISSLASSANANVAAYLTTYSGNISASNITVSGTVVANTVNAATIGNVNSNIVGSGAYITNITQSNISIYAGVTNTTTGTYYPILSGQTSSGNINLAVNSNINYVASTSTLNVANLTVSGNTVLTGATILNSGQTDGYGTTIRGVTDNTLLWVNPRTSYDQVLIGGSATSSTPVAGAKLQINSTDSMLLPMGDNASRPGTPRSGMFRYNTQLNVIEWYDASLPGWTYPTTASGSSSQNNLITNQSFTGDGTTTAFTLPTVATTSGLLVSINGVIQIPVQAYSVTSATLTFVTAPGLSDLIDVRILVPAVSVTSISDNAGNTIQLGSTGISFITANLSARTWNLTGAEVSTLPAVLVTSSGVATELDRFDLTTYSSAEYTVTGLVQGSSIRMVGKVLVVHNGTTAYVDPFAITVTSGNTIATFSGTVTGSNVILQVTTTNNNTSFKLRKNYQAI